MLSPTALPPARSMLVDPVPPQSSTSGDGIRAASVVAGSSLAAMAVLAPLGLLVALPAGRTGVAAVVVLVVAILDVVAAVALLPVLVPGGVLLARTAIALRLAYAAVFAVAGASLLAPVDEDRFQATWEAGLLVFGAHLVLVGIAGCRGGVIPAWIGVLVVVSGAGYLFDALVGALVPSGTLSIGALTFVGEVVLLVWLLVRGGRAPRGRRHVPQG